MRAMAMRSSAPSCRPPVGERSRAETARADALGGAAEPGVIELPETVVTGTPA